MVVLSTVYRRSNVSINSCYVTERRTRSRCKYAVREGYVEVFTASVEGQQLLYTRVMSNISTLSY